MLLGYQSAKSPQANSNNSLHGIHCDLNKSAERQLGRIQPRHACAETVLLGFRPENFYLKSRSDLLVPIIPSELSSTHLLCLSDKKFPCELLLPKVSLPKGLLLVQGLLGQAIHHPDLTANCHPPGHLQHRKHLQLLRRPPRPTSV